MKEMSVGEFKTKFSEVLELVKNGEEVEVLYGRTKKLIARLVPCCAKQKDRLLGLLEDKASFSMRDNWSDNWKMTPDELTELINN